MSAGDSHFLLSRAPRWVWFVGAIALLIVVVIALWDWNWFKGPVERRVSAATGRTFEIRGDLDVDIGWRPRISAHDLHLSNSEWSQEHEMVVLRDLDLRVALVPLLRGKVELPYIALDGPRLRLERNQAGEANWTFRKRQPASPGNAPHIGQLIVN